MYKYDSSQKYISTGILAHVDAGKTTLSESLLLETGVIKSAGRVDLKNAFLDNDNVERERGITIYSKNARIPLGDKEIILIDTPGHTDFSAEMERALSVLDMAVLLISGPSGIESHTKTLWSLLKAYKIPTAIFVNKMDMEGANKLAVIKELTIKFSTNCIEFSPSWDEAFFENVASTDENLLNSFLENNSITNEEISDSFFERKLFPVFFGSALKQQGISEFLDSLNKLISSRNCNSSDESMINEASFSGVVYKVSRDLTGKRLTFIKSTGGTLKVKELINEEKINELRIYSGEKFQTVQEINKGDVFCIPGLQNTYVGQTFGNMSKTVSPYLSPALSYAIKYPNDVDKVQVLRILKELEEEDPSLNINYNEDTKEIFVSLMGDIQTEVLKRTIFDKYNINVNFTEGKVIYKETINSSSVGVGHFEPLRHYAEVHIKMEPLERGQGLMFDTDVSEDFLDKNWQRLILTHLKEREHRGVLTGAPVTDIKFTLVAGKAHIKHTEGGDFRQATYRAIRQGLMKLLMNNECHLLEPYYDYTLKLPETYVGRAMTDINAMPGTCNIAENDYENHIVILTGRAPVSSINGYVRDVAAYSKGLGELTFSISGYDLCHNEEEVLSNNHYDPDKDVKNPSSSVFCSHGAGTVIPWYEVDDYKHIEYDGLSFSSSMDKESYSANAAANRARKEYDSTSAFISTEEIDSILKQTSHANENGRKGSYKGISNAVRLRNRLSSKPTNEEPVYKGTKLKEKYLLIDGYNVIHAWDELNLLASSSLDAATGKLNDILCNYQAMTEVNLIVVYDAYKVPGHKTEENAYHNITVVYTKESQTADQYIERYANQNASKYDITVVTSDGLEQIIIRGEGCHLMSSREFEIHVNSITQDFNKKYGVE